jgi:aryl-alcohol dehydrogenase
VVPSPGADFELVDVDLDGPRSGEVLVRIVATGLCHTDLSTRDTLPPAMFPRVLGHEGAGVVEEVGNEVDGISVGDLVVLSFSSCGSCASCSAGHVGYCDRSVALNHRGERSDGSTTYTIDGRPVFGSFFGQSSFARHAIATPDNVVVVDPALDVTRLGPYGCSFQTGAGTVLNVLQSGPTDRLVVLGVGAVGLAAVATACSLGVGTVVAVDRHPQRLAAAREYAATTVDATQHEGTLVEEIRRLTDGGPTQAIDTTGVGSVIADAALALAPRGQLVLLALGQPQVSLDVVDLLVHGKVVRGSVEGDSDPRSTIPDLLARAGAGRLPLDRLVTPYPFAEINRAATDVLAGSVVKPVLVW